MAKLYGRGSIEQIIKGKKYRIQQPCGKDPITGKYIRIRETFLGTKRQAEMRLEQIRREVENGKAVNADKISFAEWCENYLSMREGLGKHRPATYRHDRMLSKHLKNGLGSVLVVDITPAVVNDFYASLRAAGVGDTTVRECHGLLKRILKYAVNNDVIMRNPCDRVETPRKPKPNRHALDTEDAARLGAVCLAGCPSANKTAVYLGLATGARLGEVLGLTWAHVALDEARPYVYVVQQFTRFGEVAPLKTDKDDNPTGRVIPLDGSTVAVLSAWKAEQRQQLNALGVEQGVSTPVITNGLGEFTDHANFERWWRSFCVENRFARMVDEQGREIIELAIGDDAALFEGKVIEWRDADGWPCDETGKRFSRSYKRPRIKRHYEGLHFHELRHTHFTMRLANGMDIPTAQALGGWSSPAMLMTVYAHPVTENIWQSAGFMDDLNKQKHRV